MENPSIILTFHVFFYLLSRIYTFRLHLRPRILRVLGLILSVSFLVVTKSSSVYIFVCSNRLSVGVFLFFFFPLFILNFCMVIKELVEDRINHSRCLFYRTTVRPELRYRRRQRRRRFRTKTPDGRSGEPIID